MENSIPLLAGAKLCNNFHNVNCFFCPLNFTGILQLFEFEPIVRID